MQGHRGRRAWDRAHIVWGQEGMGHGAWGLEWSGSKDVDTQVVWL